MANGLNESGVAKLVNNTLDKRLYLILILIFFGGGMGATKLGAWGEKDHVVAIEAAHSQLKSRISVNETRIELLETQLDGIHTKLDLLVESNAKICARMDYIFANDK